MYSKDEKVLCFHHDILYDAKILDVRLKDGDDKKSVHEYLVHYKGWKNTSVSPALSFCTFPIISFTRPCIPPTCTMDRDFVRMPRLQPRMRLFVSLPIAP